MNQEIKKRWIDALRSGDYEQGGGYLQTVEGKFCCLGVLCELAVKDGIINEPHREFCTIYYGLDKDDNADAVFLPEQVREWAGLEWNNPVVQNNGLNDILADMNDNKVPFDRIADVIEASL